MPVSTRRHPDDRVERAPEDDLPHADQDGESVHEEHQPAVTPRADPTLHTTRTMTRRCDMLDIVM